MSLNVKVEQLYRSVIMHVYVSSIAWCRTPNPDMHLMLKSPSGKIPVKRDAAHPSGSESVVSLFGGYASGTGNTSLEHTRSVTNSVAARCLPYSTYDAKAKYKVSFAGVLTTPPH